VTEEIADHQITAPHQAADRTEISLITGCENDCALLIKKFGQRVFQSPVQVGVTTNQRGRASASAEITDSLVHGLGNPLIARQSEVVISDHADLRRSVEYCPAGPVRRLQYREQRIDIGILGLRQKLKKFTERPNEIIPWLGRNYISGKYCFVSSI
jgi:hypothetical protein